MEVRELLTLSRQPPRRHPDREGLRWRRRKSRDAEIGENSISGADGGGVDEYIPTPARAVDLPFLMPTRRVSILGPG